MASKIAFLHSDVFSR